MPENVIQMNTSGGTQYGKQVKTELLWMKVSWPFRDLPSLDWFLWEASSEELDSSDLREAAKVGSKCPARSLKQGEKQIHKVRKRKEKW